MNKKPIEKNKEYIVDIIDNGFEGEGIAKIDNFIIFIPGAIKGEKIKILIVNMNYQKINQDYLCKGIINNMLFSKNINKREICFNT